MWTGSTRTLVAEGRGGPWLDCWECPPEFRYFHEAMEHEEKIGHAVCGPKDRLAADSCGCAVCGDEQALRECRDQFRAGVRRAKVTWRRWAGRCAPTRERGSACGVGPAFSGPRIPAT